MTRSVIVPLEVGMTFWRGTSTWFTGSEVVFNGKEFERAYWREFEGCEWSRKEEGGRVEKLLDGKSGKSPKGTGAQGNGEKENGFKGENSDSIAL